MRARPQSESGFSLTEMLVAIFVMALATSLLAVTLPARKDPLEVESGTLAMLVSRIADEAVATGTARAIRIDERGYQVFNRVGGHWVPVSKGNGEFSGGVKAQMELSGRSSSDAAALPQIIADATGIVTAPALLLERGSRKERLVFRPDGQIDGHVRHE